MRVDVEISGYINKSYSYSLTLSADAKFPDSKFASNYIAGD